MAHRGPIRLLGLGFPQKYEIWGIFTFSHSIKTQWSKEWAFYTECDNTVIKVFLCLDSLVCFSDLACPSPPLHLLLFLHLLFSLLQARLWPTLLELLRGSQQGPWEWQMAAKRRWGGTSPTHTCTTFLPFDPAAQGKAARADWLQESRPQPDQSSWSWSEAANGRKATLGGTSSPVWLFLHSLQPPRKRLSSLAFERVCHSLANPTEAYWSKQGPWGSKWQKKHLRGTGV